MRVLLADDHAAVRWALRTFLAAYLGPIAFTEATHSRDLLPEALAQRPDLVFLDWDLPGLPACEILGLLSHQLASCKIVVVGRLSECRGAALEAGADAFVSHTAPPDQVIAVLHRLGVAPARSL